jgi:hypothetical protein
LPRFLPRFLVVKKFDFTVGRLLWGSLDVS